MERVFDEPRAWPESAIETDPPAFCWRELLDQALTGWSSADQSMERIIDRWERNA